jgi:hypothetical protein
MCGEKFSFLVLQMTFSRPIAIAVLMLTTSSSFAGEANGFLRRESCSFLDSYRLHLIDFDDRKLDKPIVLKFPGQGAWYSLVNTWQELVGEDCTRSYQCQGITHAKVYVEHVSRAALPHLGARRIIAISGKFELEYSNGRKLEGSFRAKTRQPEHRMDCG